MANAQAPQPQSAPPDGIWVPALKEAGVAFVAAAVLLAIFYVFAFRWIHPEFVPFMDREATKLIAPGKDLIPVSVGGYRIEGSSAIIEDFNGDEAILALPRAFQAEDYPFIKVNLEGFTRYSKFKILWRQAEDLSQTHALEFNRSGDEATQIAMVYGDENYRGRIADIALLFFDGPALGFENNNDVDIAIQSIELRSFSARGVAEQISEDWFNPPLWQGSAHNTVRGIHSSGMISFSLVANLLIVVALALSATMRNGSQKPHPAPFSAVLLSVCLLAFASAEVIRLNWRIEQATDVWARYKDEPLSKKIRNNPIRCARKPNDCFEELLPYF